MNKSIVLGLETSGIVCSVAWWQNGETLLEYNIERENAHAAILAGLIKKGHKALAIDSSAVALLAVGSGPGSFTGLRIGMSFAKGFCMGRNIPLVAVTNFNVLAEFATEISKPVYTLIEARHAMYYTGVFSHKNGELTKKYLADKKELVSEIPEEAQIIVHEEKNKGAFRQILSPDRRLVQGAYKSSIICAIGQRIFEQQAAPALDDIEPLYVQAFAGVL